MGIAPKIVTTTKEQAWVIAWDYLNLQAFDYKREAKTIIDFALKNSGNTQLKTLDIGCGAAHLDFF